MIRELRIVVDHAHEEMVEDFLAGAGSMGVARVVDGELGTVTGFFAEDAAHEEVEIGLRLLLASAGVGMGQYAVAWKLLPDCDWAEAWKASYHPLPVGRGLLVLPSWLEPPPDNARQVIRMDPEMAFGSGTHATTRGCLELLEELAGEGGLGAVLDMGTGSGILAIWAALLGAGRVVATDLDPVAVETAGRNCQLNGVGERVEILEREEVPAGPFQTIVANILASVLIGVAPRLAAALAPGGRLILSGILRNQTEDVENAFAGQGLQRLQWRLFEEWAVLVFCKENS